MSRRKMVYFTILKNRKTNIKSKRRFVQYTGKHKNFKHTNKKVKYNNV